VILRDVHFSSSSNELIHTRSLAMQKSFILHVCVYFLFVFIFCLCLFSVCVYFLFVFIFCLWFGLYDLTNHNLHPTCSQSMNGVPRLGTRTLLDSSYSHNMYLRILSHRIRNKSTQPPTPHLDLEPVYDCCNPGMHR
jgi:hypothetical protein